MCCGLNLEGRQVLHNSETQIEIFEIDVILEQNFYWVNKQLVCQQNIQ